MFTKAFYQQVNNELFMMKVMKSPKHIDFTIQKKKKISTTGMSSKKNKLLMNMQMINFFYNATFEIIKRNKFSPSIPYHKSHLTTSESTITN